ncbi:MAG: hypothetical protein ACD_30C00002G0039 [uncultured bacterium]|uniref:DNA-3-methyladenine glycosylase II n=4 Tax=Candidatus Daviesiibacteriota TaxID=1752718 RepID=A0A0G0EU45_9BACT|nr:MAG: hypothetical protein ACD_30C00002G0039 [uncultured bacterium]KKQ10433.1 MAG: DNA-3-methyladenine glycosylase [Candidatus Daviesbacteria bacterium GW2011_GWB1_36_5]KKQ13620.1 MAG: DNA-3-methyladenine glycosylase [Candidatus Daviesbacteria bacterium GW2011_GWA1_36_8]OGE16592.1 MAG: hypothetical protein A2858_01970 [Candidatus Daviesbacteria bacterium RIFCSPHIGHO2_01_FULL_36_37]OGE31727.1 MAG: hypothetical protein A3C99_02835 [Candidatus Daviesbacteria bacterium RIFCSPHIGHO2_02_FULL_37_9]
MSTKIILYFEKSDPVIYSLIEEYGLIEVVASKTYFINLCRSIINQQISNKAGRAVFERFINLFPNKIPTPEKLLKIKDEKLRSVGMSKIKVSYLKDLSKRIIKKELLLEKIEVMEDTEVIEQLIRVKGIGVWTAEMFLMFSLGREDIFSHGDIGLRNAIKKLYFLENPSRKEIEKIVENWSPYKTYVCKLLWRSLNNQ